MNKEYRFVHARRKGSKKNKNGNRNGNQMTMSTSERSDAAKGKFPFTEINGFQLKEVEWIRKRVKAAAKLSAKCAPLF